MVVAAALCAVVIAQSQIAPDEVRVRGGSYYPIGASGVIRTSVDLVEVPVVVRDSKGRAIPGLTRQDFELLDAGKRREITSFAVKDFSRAVEAAATSLGGREERSPPSFAGESSSRSRSSKSESAKPRDTSARFIALVLDDLNTDFATLRRGKTAAEKYVSESLAPGDRVAVVTTALDQEVVFTSDIAKLTRQIEALEPHPRLVDTEICEQITSFETCDVDMSNPAVRAKLMARGVWQTVWANSESTLRSIGAAIAAVRAMPGHKMVVVASSGFYSYELEDRIQGLITAALRSGVIINSIDLRGLFIPSQDDNNNQGPTRNGRSKGLSSQLARRIPKVDTKADAIAELASGTGGQFIHNTNDLAAGFREVAVLPELVYILGFNVSDVSHDGKFHELRIRLIGGRTGAIQARAGYTAPPKEQSAESAKAAARDRLVMSPEVVTDVAARVSASARGREVVVRAEIDLKKLNFEIKDGRRTQRLGVTAALLDPSGEFVIGREGEADLSLSDATYQELASKGFSLSLLIPAAAGAYRVRVVIEEGLVAKKTAVSQSVLVER